MERKEAIRSAYRVLKPGGTFCGCFYVKGEQRRTDWLTLGTVKSIAWFVCRKAK